MQKFFLKKHFLLLQMNIFPFIKILFNGIYSHEGIIREFNITKKEWVLNGETVLYGSASELKATLDYDFSEEKNSAIRTLEWMKLSIILLSLYQGSGRTTSSKKVIPEQQLYFYQISEISWF